MQIVFAPEYSEGESFTLSKEESSHIVRVLRMREGEEVLLTDGRGQMFCCEIVDANPNRCSLNIKSAYPNSDERNFYIHLAVAPTKNIARIEWLLEKVTEMGVDEITPLLCEHSERKTLNSERLDKILVSAMKQSLKSYKPKLNPLTKLKDFLPKAKEQIKLLAYCGQEEKYLIKDICAPKSSYLVLIGPEGDFSQKEIELAKDNGFRFLTLGPQRLRTETAGLFAVANLHFINQ
ncbi:MAG: 16S rRNA (uracil(1498)-N(3))-methyltransferase [Bacteroidales bacterium]|nr:16S rRNA (uracil(1498)-N(3))-methyltransferase [Bacteroidales bacterium]